MRQQINADLRIYCAGRMEEPCWRPFDSYRVDGGYDGIPPERITSLRGYPVVYTGPFRTELGSHSYLHGLGGAATVGEATIFKRSLAGIRACDVLFAYFNDRQAFGTLVEVGIAHGLGKRIIIGFDNVLQPGDGFHWAPDDCSNDLWFAAQCAETVYTGNKDQILQQFSDWLCNYYRDAWHKRLRIIHTSRDPE